MTTDAHAAPAKDKPSPTATVWRVVGTVIGVSIALIVLFYITRFFFPEIFNGFNGTLSVTSSGLTEGGIRLGLLGTSVGIFGGGALSLYFRVLVFVIFFAIVGWGSSVILGKIKATRAGGGGAAAAHHP